MRTRATQKSPKHRYPGIIHEYAEQLVAFEYTRGSRVKPHTILFVGGLGDGLCTVEFVTDIAEALESTEWSIFSLVLSSSYSGWGVGGLGKDIDEMAQCVEYVREYKSSQQGFPPGKIVIMGHSTGSQDVLHYISRLNPRPAAPILDRDTAPPYRPQVDGAIMQAPVSDREAIQWVLEEGNERHSPAHLRHIYEDAIARSRRRMFEDYDHLDTILPLPVTTSIGYPSSTPVSSRRFMSLASPDSPQRPAEDDLFSSDLTDERLNKTFGMIGQRGILRSKLLVLYSGKDQSVPPWVDKEALLRRWKKATDRCDRAYWHEESGIIPNASHALSDPDQAEPRRILVQKVTRFIFDIESK